MCDNLSTSTRRRADEAHTAGLKLAGKREAYDEIVAELKTQAKFLSNRGGWNTTAHAVLHCAEVIEKARP